jgi:hypothetical protein
MAEWNATFEDRFNRLSEMLNASNDRAAIRCERIETRIDTLDDDITNTLQYTDEQVGIVTKQIEQVVEKLDHFTKPDFASSKSYDPDDGIVDTEPSDDSIDVAPSPVLQVRVTRLAELRQQVNKNHLNQDFDERMSKVLDILSKVTEDEVLSVRNDIRITDNAVCTELCSIFPSLIGAEEQTRLPGDANKYVGEFMHLLRSVLDYELTTKQTALRRTRETDNILNVLSDTMLTTQMTTLTREQKLKHNSVFKTKSKYSEQESGVVLYNILLQLNIHISNVNLDAITPIGSENIFLKIEPLSHNDNIAKNMAILIVKLSDELNFLDMVHANQKEIHLNKTLKVIQRKMDKILDEDYMKQYRTFRYMFHINKIKKNDVSDWSNLVRCYWAAMDTAAILVVLEEMDKNFVLGPRRVASVKEVKDYYTDGEVFEL